MLRSTTTVRRVAPTDQIDFSAAHQARGPRATQRCGSGDSKTIAASPRGVAAPHETGVRKGINFFRSKLKVSGAAQRRKRHISAVLPSPPVRDTALLPNAARRQRSTRHLRLLASAARVETLSLSGVKLGRSLFRPPFTAALAAAGINSRIIDVSQHASSIRFHARVHALSTGIFLLGLLATISLQLVVPILASSLLLDTLCVCLLFRRDPSRAAQVRFYDPAVSDPSLDVEMTPSRHRRRNLCTFVTLYFIFS